ncbi:glycosyltransferase family A protein [Clostridium perfringens]|nr:glycosyltransferase family 2 protein [Clostridium perfringens]MDK0633329.1 glycosyltransferase family A protein [Clostridium perfringens]MDK0983792.1 glycosyltransferase family A protein [Clostridium perfringens]
MKKITVITTTYNRALLLPNVFNSLQMQTSKEFEWLVVDDGSNDDTENIVADMKKKATFEIRYLKKENGGKHKALNLGISKIITPLTIILDSDDSLLPNAIELIIKYALKYKCNKNIGVFSFLKCYTNGEIVVPMENDEIISDYTQYRIKENRPGDMAEVFYTNVLKEVPFPEFKGERFLSEDVVWIEIAKKYKCVFVNIPIYQCEYLEDGLTFNDKAMKFDSPLGSMMRGKALMNKECGLKTQIKGAIIYNCYKNVLKEPVPKELLLDTYFEKTLVFLTLLLGVFYCKKWNPA